MYDRGTLWSYLECKFLLYWTMAEWLAQGPNMIQLQQHLPIVRKIKIKFLHIYGPKG